MAVTIDEDGGLEAIDSLVALRARFGVIVMRSLARRFMLDGWADVVVVPMWMMMFGWTGRDGGRSRR